ncbi:DUF58 domain-containing protein [Alginatibacterium sediminis]|uniref:DUF58 domain-containing protein n=1 Tax=Alginatibacterium sediminis TaxID=2164068 RepID=A0A420EG81_9ALTE|nr:DUF58 domain-containing protein [Alginatibacterium sediminis]RKF19673.1 DUF58 domain-containing protein [Alginatibacterium sediminis]
MTQIERSSAVQLGLSQLLQSRYLNLGPQLKRHRAMASRSGQRISNIRGRGMEFDEARHYQAGDDIRSIDWRVTARTGKAHTKLFREEREQPVIILLDINPSMIFGSQHCLKSIVASELAAYLGWAAIGLGERVAVVINQGQQHVSLASHAARQAQWLQLLQQIVDCHQQQLDQFHKSEAPSNLSPALEQLNLIAKTGYQIHLISDFYHLQVQDIPLLQRLSRRNQVMAWQITDPFESQIENEQTTRLQIEGAKGLSSLWPSKRFFRSQYQHLAEQRQSRIEETFANSSIVFDTISTAKDWHENNGI